jgi:hypothetical protein
MTFTLDHQLNIIKTRKEVKQPDARISKNYCTTNSGSPEVELRMS